MQVLYAALMYYDVQNTHLAECLCMMANEQISQALFRVLANFSPIDDYMLSQYTFAIKQPSSSCRDTVKKWIEAYSLIHPFIKLTLNYSIAEGK